MTNSPLPINGKRLADRWNIETIDLMYIILNHGLNVVDQYYDEVDIGDVLEDFKKNKDASDYMFSLSEVKAIENSLKVDGEIPHAETIRGKDLMARWQKHEGEIRSIMFTHGLTAIDPFGHELDSTRTFTFLNNRTLYLSDLLFRLSDIKKLESENPEIVADRVDDKKPEEKPRPCQIHRIKCSDVAQNLWDEDPNITIADMIFNDEIIEACNGKVYAEKTIRNWIKDLCPNRSPGRRPKKK
jgi:hypothetical protein